MTFEITNEEEADQTMQAIIVDLQRVSRLTYKIENLRDIRTSITDLIAYYRHVG